MSETSDYDPGVWSGHDFGSARAAYDSHVGRSYGDATAAKVDATDLAPATIETKSPSPMVIWCDVTGSMGEWPATIFSKLPYLELEGQEYLGKDMEIAWGAIGDAYSDKYPLQVRPFSKGVELKEQLQKLIIEKNGGGQQRETYELAALYNARNVITPNALRPICIIIGDEGFYDIIAKSDAETHARVHLEGPRIEAAQVFQELMKKFSVYLIRKPYQATGDTDDMSDIDKLIHAQWEKVLGADRICVLPGAERVVDVIFGILARETDRVDYFKDEIAGRQKPDQVKTVMKSLKTVHLLAAPKDKDSQKKSRMHKKDDGKKTNRLI